MYGRLGPPAMAECDKPGEVPAAETMVGGAIVLASVFGRLIGEQRSADKMPDAIGANQD